MTIALVVGRFQPLHNGHLKLLEYCESNYSAVTVVLGKSSDGRTKRNPLLVSERKQIFNTVKPSFTVCSATEDFSGGFTQNVLKNITGSPSDYTLVSHNETTINELSSVFDFEKPPTPIICRGTEIRESIVKDKEWIECVPNKVYQVLKQVDFEEKVKNTYNL